MAKKESSSYNPFGEEGYVYSPDADNRYHIDGGGTRLGWVKIILVFAVVLFSVTLIGNIVFMSNQRNNAVESMGEFNAQAGQLHRMLINNETRSDFSSLAEDDNAPDEINQSAEVIIEVSDYLKDNDYTPLIDGMDDYQASEIVIPYYSVCDVITIMKSYPDMSMPAYAQQCETFSAVSIDMMGKIKNYNGLNNSIAGFFNPLAGENLPDVTS